MVIWRGIKLVPHLPAGVIDVRQNVVSAFIALTIVLAISAGLNLVNHLYQRRPDAARRPIKGYIEVAKSILFDGHATLILAFPLHHQPQPPPSGLGAVSPVFIPVFHFLTLCL